MKQISALFPEKEFAQRAYLLRVDTNLAIIRCLRIRMWPLVKRVQLDTGLALHRTW